MLFIVYMYRLLLISDCLLLSYYCSSGTDVTAAFADSPLTPEEGLIYKVMFNLHANITTELITHFPRNCGSEFCPINDVRIRRSRW